MQALRTYTKEAEEKEQQRLANLASSGDINAILDSDALAREVITSEIQDEQYEAEIQSKVDELRTYTKDLLESEQDLVVNTTRKILEANPDPNLNTVYDEVLSGIQQSRKDKLSNVTFGVMGNTIALEQARQFGSIAREDAKQELEAREEALALGYCSEEELDDFFKEPIDAAGNRMFRSIVRNILEKRTFEAKPVAAIDEKDFDEEKIDKYDLNDEGADDQQTESDTAVIGSRKSIYYQDEEAKKKWTLTPSEKVEAFQLLKQWRAVYNERSQALKEKKRPVNNIKPLFLYSEESEQTKQWQKEEVDKALRRQLDTDDDVEKASNDLLIKELMEGGYTKERSLRLVDKLIEKANDRIIKDALLDMKTTLMEQDDSKDQEKTKELPKKPLFVDMKQVLSREEDDDVPPPPKQLKQQDASRTVQPQASQVIQQQPIQTSTFIPKDEDEDDLPSAVSRPASDFFATPTDVNISPNRTTTTSELLGSYEDQLFEKLASKTGVTTQEEKAEFKRNLDEINTLRSKILSDVEDERLAREKAAKSGVNASSLLEEGGDADSIEKLLSKRPVVPSQDSAKHEIIESFGNLEEMGGQENNDIINARYRALFGPDSNTEEEDEYRNFLMEEEELRKKAENNTLVEFLSGVDPTNITDVDKYADEVISKLKPRPQPTEEEEYPEEVPLENLDSEISRLESAFEMEEDQEDFDPFPVAEIPTWLEKEAEIQGMRRKESKKDNELDKEKQRELEERQKMADAYIERTNKGVIDISEVLDRPYFGSMDEPDDYKKKSYAMSNYEGRKDELMEYTT